MHKGLPELTYAQPVPFHRQKRVHRWAIGLAVLVLAVALVRLSLPVWGRYEFYRLQGQAATYENAPDQVLLRHSSTQPYTHVPGAVDALHANLWTAGSEWGPGTITPTPTRTPLFCRALRSPAGRQNIVQIYASIIPPTGTSRGKVNLMFTQCSRRNVGWIFGPSLADSKNNHIDMASLDFSLEPENSLPSMGAPCVRRARQRWT